MKKISAFFVMLMLMFAAGICVHAADFDVDGGARLPDGEAYKAYSAQINMTGGNDGYTFEFVSGFKPAGLTVNSDGSVTGTPTSSGFYSSMNIRISHTDGTSEVVSFSIMVMPRSISVVVDSPANLVYDGQPHTAQVKCYDADGNLIDDIVPSVKYGADWLDAATNAGTYAITVLNPSGCLITDYTGDEYLIINTQSVTELSAADKTFQYDGNSHGITDSDVTVNPSAAGYTVEYRKTGASAYTADEPVAAGTYEARLHTVNSNYETVYATATVTILAQEINFTVTNTTAEYDGARHEVSVACDKSDVDYTVSYTDASGNPAEPISAGTYNVVITLANADAYTIGAITGNTLTITPKTIKFTAAQDSFEYDGTEKTPVISTDPVTDVSLYTVSYRKTGETSSSAILDAGTYDVVITLTDSNNYVIDDSSTKTITVTAQVVNFTVTDNTVTYDGNAHKATVTTESDIPQSSYTVQYRKNGVLTNSVTDAGEYEIVITVSDSNYALDSAFSGTMTVISAVSLNIGNSPAAMIYKDNSHSDNADWQAAALNALVTTRRFSSDYLPSGCSADIAYGLINNIDIDGDKYTVIVTSLDAFVDPGLSVNGSTVTGSSPVQVEGIEGLYKVTYTYNDENYERYVAVVRKIGDTNGDGFVNAVDANYLDNKNTAPSGVTEARVWDVNKDGMLDANDAAAIRSRYKTALTSYYPWL